jgi:hypothetical protein
LAADEAGCDAPGDLKRAHYDERYDACLVVARLPFG